MIHLIYNLLLHSAGIVLEGFSLFRKKTKIFIKGRKGLIEKLEGLFNTNNSPLIWVHCASLGEFEQGRPVIEALKREFPTFKILLTFFSPSGYEIRKNYTIADHICYLPLDTPSYARRFIMAIQPSLCIFVKYEFWPNYLLTLKKKNIPVISISSIFRPDQFYFKWYGGLFLNALKTIKHFFVQNENSKNILLNAGIKSVSVVGDTRFDRVYQIVQQAGENEIARAFKRDQPCWVIGSSWPEDMEILIPFIQEYAGYVKFIIAPHRIEERYLQNIEETLHVKSVRYSKFSNSSAASVLIIDNIGMLAQLYGYGNFAYVGGAFGKGLHNILEAACYGIPIFFGNKNFRKFQEAVDLIKLGGAFAVSDYTEMKNNYKRMVANPQYFSDVCSITKQFVMNNLGATGKIISYCKTLLVK